MEREDPYLIKIFDNSFPKPLLELLFSFIEGAYWQFGSKYTDDDPFSMKFWGFPIMTGNDLSMI